MSELINRLTLSEMQAFLVKFFFKEGQFHLIPEEIREIERDSVKAMDRRHAQRAVAAGYSDRAELGRKRPGRTDTGDDYLLTNVRIELDPTLFLVDCHQHYQAGQLAKGRQREQKSVRVVTLSYVREKRDNEHALDASIFEGIKSLQNRAWQVCNVWANPNGLGTLNFKGLNDCLPEHAVTKYVLGTKIT